MRIDSLTFLRFLAAFIVVIFHLGKGTWFTSTFGRIATSGPQMVSFFFVLSGFVMVLSQFRKPNFSIKEYYFNRFIRIYPLYLFGIIIIYPFKSIASDGYALLLNLFTLQSWFPPYPLSFNGPSWSISVEAFFYMLFPFILYYIKNAKPRVIYVFMFSLFIWGVTQLIHINLLNKPFYNGPNGVPHQLIYYLPISHLGSFLLGITAAYLFLRLEAWKTVIKPSNPIYTVLALVLMYSVLLLEPKIVSVIGYRLPFGGSFHSLIFSFCIFVIAASDNIMTKVLSNRVFVFLGEISFAIYLLHSPLYKIYKEYFQSYIITKGFSKTGELLIFLTAMIFISSIVYVFYEKPISRYFHKGIKKFKGA
ncbi:acyltransferase family protein [Sediminitomix flava]|uniref:Peptidoglycan/LPS O-acetylase OafA/YrhL n=1 Tax=Sediminitomix flava TaxID=379075 RepID=A0A315Z8P8_SEDFL|nr:acyltransferase [Sediminitomix flava]PWJ40935.1 peptidoglycan/LPS O-acetylase OafA/YrhL [Sediminitomix flava]